MATAHYTHEYSFCFKILQQENQQFKIKYRNRIVWFLVLCYVSGHVLLEFTDFEKFPYSYLINKCKFSQVLQVNLLLIWMV